MIRSRKRFWHSRPFIVSAIVVALGLASFLLIYSFRSGEQPMIVTDLSGEETFDDASFENDGKWYGLCKKDSIRSIEDFYKTVASDETLRVHFAGFQWERAEIKRLEKATPAYVYFRKNDVIFRKEKAIQLPAGDEYITDGKTKVRTHCCNDYAEAPPLVASDVNEAPEEALPDSVPRLSAMPGTGSQAPGVGSVAGSVYASGGGVGGGLIIGGGRSSGGGGGGSDSPVPPIDPPPVPPVDPPPVPPVDPPPVPPIKPPPPTEVPEPGQMVLLSLGLAVFAALVIGRYFRARRSRS